MTGYIESSELVSLTPIAFEIMHQLNAISLSFARKVATKLARSEIVVPAHSAGGP